MYSLCSVAHQDDVQVRGGVCDWSRHGEERGQGAEDEVLVRFKVAKVTSETSVAETPSDARAHLRW